jgi:hypothetical protein
MTTSTEPAGRAAQARPAPFANPLRAPARLWLRGAFLLAGAAQLITISALLSADPESATWAMLLLAIAPVLLAATAAFAPAPVNIAAAVAGAAAMLVGLIGAATDTGPFFAPALAALAIAAVKLWLERAPGRPHLAQNAAVSSG